METAGSLAGDITKSEIDLWFSQRLACLADLGNWKEIMKEIVFETTDNDGEEPDFQRLWEPTKRENHLGYFIRGALRESAYHTSLTEFVQSSSDTLPKRQILLDEFSTQLATLTAINKEWDRTKFQLGQCNRVFRRHWTALHPLALRARHLRVRQLQKTVELEEFITFISKAEEKELPRSLFVVDCTILKFTVSVLQFVIVTYIMSNQHRWRFVGYNSDAYVQLLSSLEIEVYLHKSLSNFIHHSYESSTYDQH